MQRLMSRKKGTVGSVPHTPMLCTHTGRHGAPSRTSTAQQESPQRQPLRTSVYMYCRFQRNRCCCTSSSCTTVLYRAGSGRLKASTNLVFASATVGGEWTAKCGCG